MLITCKECSNSVSDKAAFCPKCGFPITKEDDTSKPKKKKYKAKKMRLPNGFGRITKITGKNLRKPYRVMVTVGTREDGRLIGKLLKPNAYFETYNEAYTALLEYNKSPFDLNEMITVGELYEKWYSEYSKTVSVTWANNVKAAWAYTDRVRDIPVKTLKASHIKSIIDEGNRVENGEVIPIPLSAKNVVKSIFNMMLDYAIERDLVDKNIAKSVTVGKEATRLIVASRKGHIPFTKEETDLMWSMKDDLFVAAILIQCYSGWRPGELLDLRIQNIDLMNWTMTGGAKTDSGRNRTIPIHTRIRPLVERMYNLATDANLPYLIVMRSGHGTIDHFVEKTYSNRLDQFVNDNGLNIAHRMHDGRVTFVTNAKAADVNEYAIKRIVGHSIKDITENIYTVRNIDWLRKEIEKIP